MPPQPAWRQHPDQSPNSAAKYTAVSVREAALDVAAMADSSTKVFIYETMGRHAGWLAASEGIRTAEGRFVADAGGGKDSFCPSSRAPRTPRTAGRSSRPRSAASPTGRRPCRRFMRSGGYGITAAGRRYLEPLIRGEAYPPYGRDGCRRMWS